ncbi:MAG: branched-chain amino acid ABC transporter ATP-binding protein/permease [Actinobacteria bacterium]|nr:branched-chain amino acid ABC transporter ATP-binding protein/permease [Actinomycetota bacterium]
MKIPARVLPVAAAAVVVAAVPLILTSYWTYVVTLGVVYAVVAGSLVILTGWVGQVSLAQASFMGIGAYVTVAAYHHWSLPFWAGAVLGVAATVPVTLIVGLVALRLSGFYLAAATVAFALAMQRFAFQFDWLTGGSSGFTAPRASLPGVVLRGDRVTYWFVALVAGLLAVAAVRLRRGSLGRAFGAVRTSERAARTLRIGVTRTKLIAFALSGAVAAVGGALYAAVVGRLSPVGFDVAPSVLFLAIALVGGIEYVTGALVGGLAYALIPELARTLEISGNWVTFLLAAMLLAAVAIAPRGIVGALRRSSQVVDVDAETAEPDPDALDELADLWGGPVAPPVLALESATVRFGGVTALDAVSLEVAPGAVVGLIGPNGAGKTTCFNVLTGFLAPSGGTVLVDGAAVPREPAERRAARGLARTFQTPLLFTGETVIGNLLVAARGRADAMSEAELMLRAVGLASFADSTVRNLPFGLQRMVEIARALMTRPGVLLLDEPAAGLSTAETHRLGRLVAELPVRLGLSVVLIEHDVELVMTVAEQVYVLDFGELIAAGPPDAVRADPAVQQAYLGVTEEVSHARG